MPNEETDCAFNPLLVAEITRQFQARRGSRRLDATDAAGQVHSIAPLDVFGGDLVNYTLTLMYILYKLDSYVFQSAGGGQGASKE